VQRPTQRSVRGAVNRKSELRAELAELREKCERKRSKPNGAADELDVEALIS